MIRAVPKCHRTLAGNVWPREMIEGQASAQLAEPLACIGSSCALWSPAQHTAPPPSGRCADYLGADPWPDPAAKAIP